jgi:hypothetical protein
MSYQPPHDAFIDHEEPEAGQASTAGVKPDTLRQRRCARLAAAREVEFVRADWASFLHPDHLP